jgi:hypothetical protein
MSEVEWEIGVPTGNHVATYRGIRIVIQLDQKGRPLEMGWFIGGHLVESILADRDLESAKRTGIMVVDQRIALNEVWQQAEKDDRESELGNTPTGSPNF